MNKIYAGIDIAKASLEVAVTNQKRGQSFANDESGIWQIISHLKKSMPVLTVMEATGGLEKLLAGYLVEAGLMVAVVNPRQVRDFAKAKGKLAKTDSIDAWVLAEFAQQIQPEVRPLTDKQTEEIKALLARRQQLKEMITMENNRLWSADIKVIPSIQEHLNWLKQELKGWDNDLGDKIKQSPVWKEKDDLLKSVPGVGPVLSMTL